MNSGGKMQCTESIRLDFMEELLEICMGTRIENKPGTRNCSALKGHRAIEVKAIPANKWGNTENSFENDIDSTDIQQT